MTLGPGRWSRVKDVFEAARALPADARTPYVRDACGGDDDLRQEIASLLAAYEPAASFLEAPAAQMFPHLLVTTSLAHRRIGPYEVSSLIGHGGMGDVYKAVDTRLDRAVAIKTLAVHSEDDPQAHQRFEREARAVGALNHPHICALYDMGSQDGMDFLVMEYLEGSTCYTPASSEKARPWPTSLESPRCPAAPFSETPYEAAPASDCIFSKEVDTLRTCWTTTTQAARRCLAALRWAPTSAAPASARDPRIAALRRRLPSYHRYGPACSSTIAGTR
jgi:Protein kinase domain